MTVKVATFFYQKAMFTNRSDRIALQSCQVMQLGEQWSTTHTIVAYHLCSPAGHSFSRGHTWDVSLSWSWYQRFDHGRMNDLVNRSKCELTPRWKRLRGTRFSERGFDPAYRPDSEFGGFTARPKKPEARRFNGKHILRFLSRVNRTKE